MLKPIKIRGISGEYLWLDPNTGKTWTHIPTVGTIQRSARTNLSKTKTNPVRREKWTYSGFYKGKLYNNGRLFTGVASNGHNYRNGVRVPEIGKQQYRTNSLQRSNNQYGQYKAKLQQLNEAENTTFNTLDLLSPTHLASRVVAAASGNTEKAFGGVNGILEDGTTHGKILNTTADLIAPFGLAKAPKAVRTVSKAANTFSKTPWGKLTKDVIAGSLAADAINYGTTGINQLTGGALGANTPGEAFSPLAQKGLLKLGVNENIAQPLGQFIGEFGNPGYAIGGSLLNFIQKALNSGRNTAAEYAARKAMTDPLLLRPGNSFLGNIMRSYNDLWNKSVQNGLKYYTEHPDALVKGVINLPRVAGIAGGGVLIDQADDDTKQKLATILPAAYMVRHPVKALTKFITAPDRLRRVLDTSSKIASDRSFAANAQQKIAVSMQKDATQAAVDVHKLKQITDAILPIGTLGEAFPALWNLIYKGTFRTGMHKDPTRVSNVARFADGRLFSATAHAPSVIPYYLLKPWYDDNFKGSPKSVIPYELGLGLRFTLQYVGDAAKLNDLYVSPYSPLYASAFANTYDPSGRGLYYGVNVFGAKPEDAARFLQMYNPSANAKVEVTTTENPHKTVTIDTSDGDSSNFGVHTGDYEKPDFNSGHMVTGKLEYPSNATTTSRIDIYNPSTGAVPKMITDPNLASGMQQVQQLSKSNIDYVLKELPGFMPSGSSVLASNGLLATVPGDVDGYMTKEDFDKAVASGHKFVPKRRGTISNGTYTYSVKPTSFPGTDANDVDINVINVDQNTGFGSSRREEEMFEKYFPEEYQHAMLMYANTKDGSMDDPTMQSLDRSLDPTSASHGQRIPIVHLDGTPFTNAELMSRYDPVTSTIMDKFLAGQNGHGRPIRNKQKHIKTSFLLLYQADPEVIATALRKIGDITSGGKDKINHGLLPKLNLDDVEDNLKTLKEINYPGDPSIAKNPAKMLNLLNLWYLRQGGYFTRNVAPGDAGSPSSNSYENTVRNLTQWNSSGRGGTANGVWMNSTIGATPNSAGRPIRGYLHPSVPLKEGMHASDAVSTVRSYNGWANTKISDENAKKILEIYKLYPGVLDDKGNPVYVELLRRYDANGFLRNKDLLLDVDDRTSLFKKTDDVTGKLIAEMGKRVHEQTGINAVHRLDDMYAKRYASILDGAVDKNHIAIFNSDVTQNPPSWDDAINSTFSEAINPASVVMKAIQQAAEERKIGFMLPYSRRDPDTNQMRFGPMGGEMMSRPRLASLSTGDFPVFAKKYKTLAKHAKLVLTKDGPMYILDLNAIRRSLASKPLYKDPAKHVSDMEKLKSLLEDYAKKLQGAADSKALADKLYEDVNRTYERHYDILSMGREINDMQHFLNNLYRFVGKHKLQKR